MSARERLHRLVEELPEETLDTAVRFLEFLKTQEGQEEDDEIATAAEDELEEVTADDLDEESEGESDEDTTEELDDHISDDFDETPDQRSYGAVPMAADFELRRLGTCTWDKDWGYGSVERTKATQFLAVGHGRRLTLYVGKVLGGREAYGRNRARYLVGTGSRVIVEFAGADDYEETGRVFSILRPPRGKWYKHIWEVPEHYRRQFTIEPLANLVDDGRQHSGLAVVTHEIYPEIMARYALQRMIDGGELD